MIPEKAPITTGTITGIVRTGDRHGHPIEGVTVNALNSVAHEATTDANGAFRLEKMPPGDYSVTFKHPDHHPRATPMLVKVTAGVVCNLLENLTPIGAIPCPVCRADVPLKSQRNHVCVWPGPPPLPEAARPAEGDAVNHPVHYGGKDNPYEAIKVIENWRLGFNLGNAVKYISRAGKKGDLVEDLKKAAFYLAREITNLEKEKDAK